jgi:folate-binding protein YgfZ
VEVAPLPSWKAWTVAGPQAADLLAAGELPAYGHREVDLDGLAARLAREEDLDGVAVYTLWSEDDAAGVLAARGAVAVPPEDLDRLRIEAGRPLFGRDFGPENFPQETGLDAAVSYEKGCYLGQEVVARIHYRGGVNRQLRGLRLNEVIAVGGKVLHDGREAGVLTSATDSPRYGAIGLAILHKRVEPGESVEIEGGGTGVVCELPFQS